jgi:hypothetical protein
MKTKKDEKGKTIRYNDTANREYNNDRIFVAIAFTLLLACPGTIIRGIQESTKTIKTTDKLTAIQFELEDYLEEPTETAKEVFFLRVYIKSNHPLFLMKTNKALKEWLIDKTIELEVNNFSKIRVANVGMFIECHPHEPVIHVHEESLRKLLPSEAPEFRMKIWYASVKDKKSTKVLLIQAAPKHVTELNKVIQAVEKYHLFKYLSWAFWQPLQFSKQETTRTNRSSREVCNGIPLKLHRR